MEQPAAGIAEHVPDAQDPGRLTGRERDIECIERTVQPVSQRLDKGLLARPAIEESLRPLAKIERPVRVMLTGGKKPGRDVSGVVHRPHGFQVDADIARDRKRIHGKLTAVGDVESQILVRGTACERGFAVPSGYQSDGAGRHAQPCPDQVAQARSGNDETAPVALQDKTTRSSPLRIRQQGRSRAHRLGRHVQPGRHDLECRRSAV